MSLKGKTEREARVEILALTKEYCNTYHPSAAWKEGDRIPYAARVYDEAEMVNLVDSALDFWLTAGRYTAEFEREFAKYLGIPYCTLVNSGSSANLLAFMTLTSPLLGERAIGRGDEVITVAAAFPTTVAPIIQYGAVPVFVDITLPQYKFHQSSHRNTNLTGRKFHCRIKVICSFSIFSCIFGGANLGKFQKSYSLSHIKIDVYCHNQLLKQKTPHVDSTLSYTGSQFASKYSIN